MHTTEGRWLPQVAAALALALAAQGSLAQRWLAPGLLLYAVALALWVHLLVGPLREDAPVGPGPRSAGPVGPAAPASRRRVVLGAGAAALSALTWWGTADNAFTLVGVVAWVGSVALWCAALSGAGPRQRAAPALRRLRPRLDTATALVLIALAVAALFRLLDLGSVPPEMTSDHVEKLLDARRVQQGEYLVFFANNGGRGPLQMYLVAVLARLFGTGISFASLKLTTVLEGLALVPAVFVLGRDLVDRRTGAWASALVAISWWHTMLSRLGLRVVLTPLLVCLVLVSLMRGLRSGARGPFLAMGVWLGIGVFAYHALRIAPLLAVVGVGLAMVSGRAGAPPRRLLGHLAASGTVAAATALPLGRFWWDQPAALWDRVLRRTTSAEVELAGHPLALVAGNLRDALLMFQWRGDEAWVVSLPGAPALDGVAGALLALGCVAWMVRLAVRREPLDALLPAALIVLLLPSALALAFPVENPSLTRASGAIPLVCVLAAWPLAHIAAAVRVRLGAGPGRLCGAMFVALLAGAAVEDYRSYFVEHAAAYRRGALNPSEVARALEPFTRRTGDLGGVYLLAVPYWYDHRAIGIEAGDPGWSHAIADVAQLEAMLRDDPGLRSGEPKLFIVHPEDAEAHAVLRRAFPRGVLFPRTSPMPGRDFDLFLVPAR